MNDEHSTINVGHVSSEIPEEEEEPASRNEVEPEKPAVIEEISQPPPVRKVSKNVVTSWSDWVAKTAPSVNETKDKENTSKSQVKR